MMTDPIADMLTRIRNANRIERPPSTCPRTQAEERHRPGAQGRGLHPRLPGRQDGRRRSRAARRFKPPGRRRASRKTVLRVFLKYGPEGERVIRHIERASKPGLRLYRGYKELQAGARRPGHPHPQHQPRRHERPPGPRPAPRRRAALHVW